MSSVFLYGSPPHPPSRPLPLVSFAYSEIHKSECDICEFGQLHATVYHRSPSGDTENVNVAPGINQSILAPSINPCPHLHQVRYYSDIFFFYRQRLVFSELRINESYNPYVLFCVRLLLLSMFSSFIHGVAYSFLLLSSTSFIVFQCVILLMDIGIISRLGLLWMKQLSTLWDSLYMDIYVFLSLG